MTLIMLIENVLMNYEVDLIFGSATVITMNNPFNNLNI